MNTFVRKLTFRSTNKLEVVETADSAHTDTCTVTIRSSDVNDNTPNITVTPRDEIDIYEESVRTYNGLVIANFTATDKDSGI